MLRTLIIDDELPARSRMRRLLGNVPQVEIVGEAASGIEALQLIPELKPHVLLLDISMPGLDGMSLARMVKEIDPQPAVVFCTAWPDQALEAFECDAVDYLVKPVSLARLQAAIEKAGKLFPATTTNDSETFLHVTVGNSRQLISVERVVCLFAEDKYTTVYHDAGESVINESLVELEAQFEDQFLRVHRNALVAQNRVRGLRKNTSGSFELTLEGTTFRPLVSRRQLPPVRKLIKELK